MKNQTLVIVLLITILLLGLVIVTVLQRQPADSENNDDNINIDLDNIQSFEDCVEAGFAVMESYPRQCRTSDGRLFAEEIEVQVEYENADSDMIRVENPHPGGVVGKEFRVTGEARGNWFFEATFSIDVVSPSGSIIAGSFATAEGDWMTTEFVSFQSEIIDLPSAYVGPATLILRKANASGLPENKASVSIPIVVEY